ncbi:hypothetical protein EJ04DRAFT_549905 [Polyplosphaeria fusca]|uniref:Uncharacterized protein n=1 Tax=Polyplosphaeria fusca TaxID=682080 RepID=A0A9P4R811_9PLEO|nr:hypothetical protein EJ04DRAFT_549905 [Polyplosphaeria fusca]
MDSATAFLLVAKTYCRDRSSKKTAKSIFSNDPNVDGQKILTQDIVEKLRPLKRLQLDLLILTSFSDNSTVHWRPSWFEHGCFAEGFWTLHNPPNVVTEQLPSKPGEISILTRRMRRLDDPPPIFIKTKTHWEQYCRMYGVPENFLCEEQVQLIRMGLPKNDLGMLRAPQSYPRYPEPQPKDRGRYLLDPAMHNNLPRTFQDIGDDNVIMIHSNGAIEISNWEQFFFHASQWTHMGGKGQYIHDEWYVPDFDKSKLKYQGAGRRWSYLPWTEEQDTSCRNLAIRRIGKTNAETLEESQAVTNGGVTPADSGFGEGDIETTET